MSLLTGLFVQTTPELPVATPVIEADASVEPGSLYRVAGSDTDITIQMLPHTVDDVAGLRFAVKVFAAAPTPPGGSLIIMAPVGQQLENDTGQLSDSVTLVNQTLGTYREWVCDPDGNWLRVGGGW